MRQSNGMSAAFDPKWQDGAAGTTFLGKQELISDSKTDDQRFDLFRQIEISVCISRLETDLRALSLPRKFGCSYERLSLI